jgi:hypothetical protein
LSLLIYVPTPAVVKAPTTKQIAKAARLSRGWVLPIVISFRGG